MQATNQDIMLNMKRENEELRGKLDILEKTITDKNENTRNKLDLLENMLTKQEARMKEHDIRIEETVMQTQKRLDQVLEYLQSQPPRDSAGQ